MSATLYIKRADRPITEEELIAVNGIIKGPKVMSFNTLPPSEDRFGNSSGFSFGFAPGYQLLWTEPELSDKMDGTLKQLYIPVTCCDEGFVSAECLRDDAAHMLRPLAAALDAQLFDENDNIC